MAKIETRHSKYEEKRTYKRVSFNKTKDAKLLAYASSLPDFSNWVKKKLKAGMKKKDTLDRGELTRQLMSGGCRE